MCGIVFTKSCLHEYSPTILFRRWKVGIALYFGLTFPDFPVFVKLGCHTYNFYSCSIDIHAYCTSTACLPYRNLVWYLAHVSCVHQILEYMMHSIEWTALQIINCRNISWLGNLLIIMHRLLMYNTIWKFRVYIFCIIYSKPRLPWPDLRGPSIYQSLLLFPENKLHM